VDRFEITGTVSTRAWKPKGIWKRLKDGLASKFGGAADAIKEAYAVVTATIDENLEAKDAYGLHHEVTDDGKVILNKFALAKAVADLAANKTLTAEQKAEAKAHLLKHYRELEEEPPLSLIQGEISILDASISELKPEDIPVAPGVDIEAIKAGDDDPLEVVVSVSAGKSKRGWNYTGESLKQIVDYVNENTLSGFLGHQKPEDVDNQFPTPVTHWVGAIWDPRAPVKDKAGRIIGYGKAYFRGVVDKVAADLKRWIRSKRVTQVSIFGVPTLKNVNGEVHVIGYKPLSIDWAPLHRAGMPTELVAIGEMAELSADSDALKAFDGSHEGLREALLSALRNKYKEGTYIWVRRVFDEFVVFEYESKDGVRQFYKLDYVAMDNKVLLGDELEEVIEKTIYVPVGETNDGKENGKMTLEEMLAALRTALAKKETDLKTVLGEMGFTPEQVVELLAGEQFAKYKTAAEFGAKLAKALGASEDAKPEDVLAMAGEMAEVWKALSFDQNKPEKPADVVGEMVKVIAEQTKAAHEKLLDETIKEKVAGEQVQVLVKRMIDVPEGATKEQIVGEIDKLLEDETIKGVLGTMFTDKPPTIGGGQGGSSEQPKALMSKTVPI